MAHRSSGVVTNYRQVDLLLLLLIAFLAIQLRSTNLWVFQEKYALDNDSYRFLRIAEADLKGKPIGERDSMRWWPTGRDMGTHLSLHSHVMARVHAGLTSLGLRWPFRSFAIRYPTVCYALCIAVLYLLLARYVSALAALFGALGMAVSPPTIYRGSAGFIDRDPFCLLLVLCAYVCYAGIHGEHTYRRRLTAAILCGAFSAALGLAWEGVGLFTLAFAATLAWMAIQKQITREQLLLHLVWCAVAIPPLLLCTRSYRLIDQPYAILALFPVPCICLGGSIRNLAGRLRWRPFAKLQHRRRAEAGALAPPVAALALGLGALGALFQWRLPAVVTNVIENAFSTLGESPLYRGKSELSDMYLSDWSSAYGLSMVLFLAGAAFVASRVGGRDQKKRRWLGAITALCSIAIVSSNDVGAFLFHGTGHGNGVVAAEIAAGVIRLLGLAIWFVGMIVLGWTAWRKSDTEQSSSRAAFLIFLSVWWFLLLTTTAGAERYGFFLAPAGWAVGGYFLSRLCGWSEVEPRPEISRAGVASMLALMVLTQWCLWIAGVGLERALGVETRVGSLEFWALVTASEVAIALLLKSDASSALRSGWFSRPSLFRATAFLLAGICLAANTVSARSEAEASAPALRWLIPILRQMEQRLPSAAVVLAWWEYGSYVNVFANRTTVIDEDDYFGQERIAQIARRVYCSDDPERAARFLMENRITHWLITEDDVHIMPYIAEIARLPVPEREMRVFDFFQVRTNSSSRAEIRLVPEFPEQRPPRLYDRLTLGALGQAVRSVYLSSIRLRWRETSGTGDSVPISDVEVLASWGKTTRRLRPESVVFDGHTMHQSGAALPGVVLVQRDPKSGGIRAVYCPKRVSRFLVARLFMLNEALPHFTAMDELWDSVPDWPAGYRPARVWAMSGGKSYEFRHNVRATARWACR